MLPTSEGFRGSSPASRFSTVALHQIQYAFVAMDTNKSITTKSSHIRRSEKRRLGRESVIVFSSSRKDWRSDLRDSSRSSSAPESELAMSWADAYLGRRLIGEPSMQCSDGKQSSWAEHQHLSVGSKSSRGRMMTVFRVRVVTNSILLPVFGPNHRHDC